MATAAADAAAPASGGKKKLIIVVVTLLLLLALGIGAALLLLKKKQASDEDGEDAQTETPTKQSMAKADGTPPVFVPMDVFTVNLADKEVDRFAQVGVTLEVVDAKVADQIKAYMPAIRSNVLMVLSYKTSAELLSREGKEKLAREIKREAVRPLGVELVDEEENVAAGDGEAAALKRQKGKKRSNVVSPVSNVLFSSFIVQ